MVEIEEYERNIEVEIYKAGITFGVMLYVDLMLSALDGFGRIVFGIPDYSRMILDQVEGRRKERGESDAAGNKAKNRIAD
jgi:hypothetical protein